MEKFKFILCAVFLALLMGKSARGQLPTIYFDFYSGSLTSGTINVEVRNSANTLVFSGAYSNSVQGNGFSYKPTAIGTYKVYVTNNSVSPLNSTMCQIDGCFGFVKEQACGVGSAPNQRSSSGPVAASNSYMYTVNVTSRSDYGTKCNSGIDPSLDYYIGGIYINSGYHSQVTCLDAPGATFTSNGNFVNDSTISITTNSTLNFAAQCPSFYSNYTAEIEGFSTNPTSEVITANKVYKIRCKEVGGVCFSDWKKVYVNTITQCVITNTVSEITGITLETNYTGPNVFLIFGPPGRNGTWKWLESGVLITQGTYSLSQYNPTLGAYEVTANRYSVGSPYTLYNPEIVSGSIIVTMSGTSGYKVNFHYFAYGAAVSWRSDGTGIEEYNVIKPEGLSLSYSNCTNGKVRVFGSTEARVGDNNQIGSQGTKIQQLMPNITTAVNPTFVSNIGVYANQSDGSWGAVYDLGMLDAGFQYVYRIIGTNGVANGDYADISFTPSCPNPQITSPNLSICLGEKSQLSVSGCASNICWSNGLSTTTISVVPTITTIYEVSCITIEGDLNYAKATVSVLSNTDIPILTASATTVAPSQPVTLTVSGCSGSVVWSHNSTLTATTVVVYPTANTSYSVYCKSSSSNCNSKISTVNIVTALIPPTVSSSVTEVCNGVGSVILTATGCASTTTYLWSNSLQTTSITVPSNIGEYWVACVAGSYMSTKTYIKLKN